MTSETFGAPPASTSPEPIEVASGFLLEPLDRPRLSRTRAPQPHPRIALERAILPHLLNGRASVSFSGGRDSSLILAIAAHLARREGLPPPVALTMVHGSPASQETDWQETVIRHIGLSDWERVEVADSLDLLGPDALGVVRDHGVLLPPNAYLHLPVLRRAPEGTLITGIGGDEMLGLPGTRLARLLTGQRRPRPGDLLDLGFAAAPSALRRWWHSRDPFPWSPWLTPHADRLIRRRMGAAHARHRLRWDVRVRAYPTSRNLQVGRHALESVAAQVGRGVAMPLGSAEFAAAWAAFGGLAGVPSRTEAMRVLGADLLPGALLERRSKATFDAITWGPATRRFTSSLTPDDFRRLDTEMSTLVDADRLVSHWRTDEPYYGAMALVHWAAARTCQGTRPP